MSKKVWILIVLSLLTGIGTQCTRQTPTAVLTSSPLQDTIATVTPTLTPEPMLTYINDVCYFSFLYPSEWMVQSENDREIVLVPIQESAWEPAVPADIPQDPRIKITLGEFAVAGFFDTYPETMTPAILRARLEERVAFGADRDFSELSIDNRVAFGITVYSDPGCYKVIYWQLDAIESIIKISTGCESPYLSDFERIVNSLRQIE